MLRQRIIVGMSLLALLLAMLSSGGRASAAPAHAQTGPQTWTVLVGAEAEMEQTDMGMAGAWQLMRFYPDKLTINEGDTVIWKLNSVEMHNVLFPPPGQNFVPFISPQGNDVVANPLVAFPVGGPNYDGSAAAGSGLLGIPPQNTKEYKLTFTKAGAYNYLCAIHSAQLPNGQVVGMTGSITVQAAGSALSLTPDQVSADAMTAIAADGQAAMAAEPQAKQAAAPEPGANGTMLYHINAGFDTQTAAYMRFAPRDLTIHVGDSVQWDQTSAVTPHTVTFVSGGTEPELVLPKPQASGPPLLTLNPVVLAPSGGTEYAGQGYFNSGFMNGKDDPAPGPRTYKLTFTKPGKYEYICVLHDSMGMSGYITVLAAGAAPGMPRTGEGGLLTFAFELMAGLAALALSAGLVLRRRSRSVRN